MINLTASGIERCSRIIYFPSNLWKASSVRLSRVLKNAAWLFPSVDFVLEEQGYRFKFFAGILWHFCKNYQCSQLKDHPCETSRGSQSIWLTFKKLNCLVALHSYRGNHQFYSYFCGYCKTSFSQSWAEDMVTGKSKGKITHTVNSNYSPNK